MQHNLTTLDNGITVITGHDPNILTTFVNVIFKAGLRYENENIYGISHMLEHCLFKGTKKRTSHQLSLELETLGSSSNAYTGYINTGYFIDGLTENLDTHLDVLSDMIFNSQFNEDEVEKEKKVILQEHFMYKDDNASVAGENLYKMNFKGNPLESSIIGNENTIKSITIQQLKNYIDTYYTGVNCFICVRSNETHDVIIDKINKYFSTMKKGTPNKYDTSSYLNKAEYISEQKESAEQVNIIYNFESEKHNRSLKSYTNNLLSNILSSGMSSPFSLEMREKNPIVYNSGTTIVKFSDVGLFAVYGNTSKDNVGKFLNISSSILKESIHNISEDDFKRAINMVKVSLSRNNESLHNYLNSVTDSYVKFGDYYDNDTILKKYDQITIDDVKKVASEIFSKPPKMSIVGNITDNEANDYFSVLTEKFD